jgi:hypothetical protein
MPPSRALVPAALKCFSGEPKKRAAYSYRWVVDEVKGAELVSGAGSAAEATGSRLMPSPPDNTSDISSETIASLIVRGILMRLKRVV